MAALTPKPLFFDSTKTRNSFPWLATLGLFLAFVESSGFGFLTIFLTSSALILCPVVVSRSKSSVREESSSITPENVFSEEIIQEKESQICEKKEEKICNDENLILSSSDALSDSESIDHTTSSEEYSENEWIFRESISQRSTCSDGSISDEESLIEIALPTGHYVESKSREQDNQKSWYGLQQKWSDCSLESHFRQQTWMEMLNEMNEENLIEIDLCMGSIKCSRFEIEA